MADVKFTDLPSATTPDGTEIACIVQGGDSKQAPISALASGLTLSNMLGTLGVAHGGTGATTLTSHGVLVGETTGAIQATAAGTNGQLLTGATAGNPGWQTMSGDVTVGTTLVAAIGAGKVTQAMDVANSRDGTIAKNVAEGDVIGGLVQQYIVDVPDGVTANIDTVVTYKFRVTGVEIHKGASAGGSSDTITVENATTAITDAMSINVSGKTVVRPATFDEAQATITAGANLRVVRTKASAANVACKVIVTGVRSA